MERLSVTRLGFAYATLSSVLYGASMLIAVGIGLVSVGSKQGYEAPGRLNSDLL
jgi:hypothetical protein